MDYLLACAIVSVLGTFLALACILCGKRINENRDYSIITKKTRKGLD
jgi:hypothetical protein